MCRTTGSIAAKFLLMHRVLLDIVHVDGAHEYQDAMDDLRMWWPLVRPGGVLLADDYAPWAPGVMRACDDFARGEGLRSIRDKNKFVLRKPANNNSVTSARWWKGQG